MKRNWNWSVIWTAVSALGTCCTVAVAVWIGYNANRIAEDSKETNKRSFASMEEFNKTQRDIMNANLTKMLNDMLCTDKMCYYREILDSFGMFFYVLTDKTDKELAVIAGIPFDDVYITNSAFQVKYDIKNAEDVPIIRDILVEFNNKKSQEWGISCVQDAHNRLYKEILICEGTIYSLYGPKEEKKVKDDFAKFIRPYFYDCEFIIDCMGHLPASERDYHRKRFHYYYANEEKNAENLLKKREEKRDMLKNLIVRLKKNRDTKGVEDWQRYIKFMARNDKGGKKDAALATEEESEDNAAVKTEKKAKASQGK